MPMTPPPAARAPPHRRRWGGKTKRRPTTAAFAPALPRSGPGARIDVHLRAEIERWRHLRERSYLLRERPIECALASRAEFLVGVRALCRAVGKFGHHDIDIHPLAGRQLGQTAEVGGKLGFELGEKLRVGTFVCACTARRLAL